MKNYPLFYVTCFFLSLLLPPQAFAGSARIVDYGADVGSGQYKGGVSTVHADVAVDVDGDGDTSDDSVGYWEYSFDEPLSPTRLPYDIEATNAIFYGGLTVYTTKPGKGFIEGLLNENHELRDDWNMMTADKDKPPLRAYGLWFWKKEDFLNGGDQYPVSFDEDSIIAPHISRYYDGVDDGRWAVRDGDQFYVSEKTFSDYQAEIGRTSPRHTSYVLYPTQTNWAPYDPQPPYQIEFDASGAAFAPHVFSDVTAVGFMVYTDSLRTDDVGVKWHAVEVYAQVGRPSAPSYYADMVTVPAGNYQGQDVPAFDIGRTEVTYALWKRVWKWAVSNQYAFDLNPGYSFHKDGDMGSMDLGGSHSAAEPATDMTWADAVIWCNALSELEGRSPCYYADAALTEVLRTSQQRDFPENYGNEFAVYVDWSADGFRLPTMLEWGYAAEAGGGGFSTAQSDAWTAANTTGSTQPVGALAANAFGLKDAAGNVWEYVWDIAEAGSFFDPVSDDDHTVLGGGIFYPQDRSVTALLPYGDEPYTGSPIIGLRLARSDAGAPPASQASGELPSWSVFQGEVISASGAQPDTSLLASSLSATISGTHTYGAEDDPAYEDDNVGFLREDDAFVRISPYQLSLGEITFAQWSEVYQWAIRNAYVFDRDGDLGSMDWQTGQHTHSPEEPVTDIGWYDAVLWCNAASEYEGLDPVYYADEARTEVLRSATRWRIRMESRPGYNYSESEQQTAVYPRWEHNGYRLPTLAEWEAAYRDGNETKDLKYPWPGSEADATSYGWIVLNAEGHTHPTRQLSANGYGLYDLCGNVSEWVWDWPGLDYYRSHNPKGGEANTLFGKVVCGSNYGVGAMEVSINDEERESASRAFYGFRVARCEAGQHPEDTTFIPERVLDLNAADFDLQQDKLFRYNNWRTGSTDKAGVPDGPVDVRWAVATGGDIQSSPVMVDGVVYLGSDDGKVYAVDALEGGIRWTYDTGAAVQCAPAVVDGVVYIGAGAYLYALNAADGSLQWKYTRGAINTNVTNAPAVAHGIVFTGFGLWSTSGYSGLDAVTGQEVWRYRLAAANSGPMGVTIDGTTLYAPIKDNVCVSADLTTEYPNWESSGHHSQACMVILDDATVLYFRNHELNARNRVDGSTRWRFEVGGDFDDKPQSSPAVGEVNADGSSEVWAFVASLTGVMYAVNTANGEAQWSYATGGPIKSSPTLANGRLYFGSDDGQLYVLDAATGAYVWSYDTGDSVSSSPWVTDGAVFFASDSGTLYALEFASSPPAITTTELDALTVASSASQQLSATGGTGGYTWSLSLGKLPTGMSLSPDGLLSGTPLVSGDFPVTVTVTDEAYKAALQSYLLRVNQTPMGTPYGLQAEIANRQIELSWVDNASGESAYVVERRDVSETSVEPYEVILDNKGENQVGTGTTDVSGFWNNQNWGTDFYGSHWATRPAAPGGTAYARFIPDLNGYEGEYEVFVWYPLINRIWLSNNMPVSITHDGGVTTVSVDGSQGGAWHSLGTYTLSGTTQVEITNDYTPTGGTFAYVDAVRFLRGDGSGPWMVLTDTLSPDTTHYIDASATAGHSYEYRISAVDASTQTAYSATAPVLFVNRPKVETGGLNLFQPINWSKCNHYIDKMLSSSEWLNEWYDYVYEVSAQGIPISIPAGTEPGVKVTLDKPGDYVLTWRGTGNVKIEPTNTNYVTFVSEDLSQEPYRRVYHKDTTLAKEGLARVLLTATDSADPVHDIHVWAPGHEPVDGAEPESIFTEEFKSRIRDNTAVLRFMDWIRTNGSTQQTWADRTSTQWYTQQYPVAYEHMIALCNEMEKDMWISLPHLADDDYVQRLAHLIRTGEDNGVQVCEPLAGHLKVYVEWSNEVWNGGFDQYAYVVALIEASSGLSKKDDNFPWDQVFAYVGERAAQCWKIFMDEFGEEWPTRVVRVLGTQVGGQFIDEHMSGVARVSEVYPEVEPDAVAIAAYFGYSFFRYVLDNFNYTDPSAAELEEAFIELQRSLLEDEKPLWESSVHAANAFGLPLIAYEGGPHTVALPIDHNGDGIEDIKDGGLTVFLNNLNRDERMGDLLALTLDVWEEVGGGLFVVFNDCSPYDKYGSWGLYDGWEKTLAESPKAEAFETWLFYQQQSHIKTYQLPAGALGYHYDFTLESDIREAPASYRLVGGVLPQGLVFSSAGTLSGIPLETGTFSVDVQLTDGVRDTDVRTYDLVVTATADPTIFEPIGDTFVASWAGAKDTLMHSLLGDSLNVNSSTRMTLVKWDLSFLSGRTLTKATLHLDVSDGASGETTVSVHNNNASDWQADTVLWDSRPAISTSAAFSFVLNGVGHYQVDVLDWLRTVQENGEVGVTMLANQFITLSTRESLTSKGCYLEVEYEPDLP